jgi:hypothetical protein
MIYWTLPRTRRLGVVKEWNLTRHTVPSLSIDLQIGKRGAMLKALEAKTIIDVARVNKDRRRDGDNESKQE